MSKKTVIVGATPNTDRTAYEAVLKLKKYGHPVVALGIKEGVIDGVTIDTGRPLLTGVDTVTLYVGPKHQPGWYDYILGLKPKRIVFNPGTENPEFFQMAKERNIDAVEACTLVMLSLGNF